jgi:AcrR family transcriptional regulator
MAPRRPEQFEELREKSREKILSAALDLFANKGYDATSIDSIAKKAGISKGLIYNYFESKKSILLAIFDDAMKMGEEIMAKQMHIKEPHLKKKALVELTFDMVYERPNYIKLLTVLSLQPGVMADAREFTKSAYEKGQVWASIITGKGDNKGLIETLILGALLDGIVLNFILHGERFPLEALKKQIIKDYCAPKKNKK